GEAEALAEGDAEQQQQHGEAACPGSGETAGLPCPGGACERGRNAHRPRAPWRQRSIGIVRLEQSEESEHENLHVEDKGPVLDVVEVVLDATLDLLDRVGL